MGATINGQEYQHATLNIQATGTGAPFQFARFKGAKYKDSAPKKPVEDHQGQRVSYTIDKQNLDLSVTMLLSEWFRFRDWLRLQASKIAAEEQRSVGIGQVAFDMTFQYGNTIATRKKDRVLGAMVNEEGRDSKDDQNALETEVPMFLMAITDENGNSFIEYDV